MPSTRQDELPADRVRAERALVAVVARHEVTGVQSQVHAQAVDVLDERLGRELRSVDRSAVVHLLGHRRGLGVDRSELLREALHRHLVRLRAEDDIEAWTNLPLTEDETAFAEIADWGPAEDWSDWADAEG